MRKWKRERKNEKDRKEQEERQTERKEERQTDRKDGREIQGQKRKDWKIYCSENVFIVSTYIIPFSLSALYIWLCIILRGISDSVNIRYAKLANNY